MADPVITALGVRDASGTTKSAAVVDDGSGNLFAAQLGYGWTGAAPKALLVDSAGRPMVSGAAAAGAAIAGNPVLAGGSDGANARSLLVDTSGRQLVAGAAAAGAAIAGNPVRVGGSDGANTRDLLTDTSGRLIVAPTMGRRAQVQHTFTPGAAYSANQAFGVTIAFDFSAYVGAAQALLELRNITMFGTAGTVTAAAGVAAYLFNAAPSTTFTDALAPTFNSADNGKLQAVVALTQIFAASSNGLCDAATSPNVAPQIVQTDASGVLRLQMLATGTWTLVTPAAFAVNINVAY